jgi:hypothetical protein
MEIDAHWNSRIVVRAILGMLATISGVCSLNEIKGTASPLPLAVHCQVGKRVHDLSC